MKTCRRLIACLCLLLPAAGLVAQTAARTNPKMISTPQPDYPAALIDTGKEGTAVIEFTVAPDGSVQAPKVKSTDDPAFAEAALAVLPQWKFEPGTRDGAPAATKVALPFKFTAPADQKINAIFGRKVFQDLPTEPLADSDYRGSLAPLNQPPVRYPANHAGSGQEHTVEVAFVIAPDGHTLNPSPVGEVPPDFAATAIMHVAALVFEPPMKDGKPVHVATRRQVRVSEK